MLYPSLTSIPTLKMQFPELQHNSFILFLKETHFNMNVIYGNSLKVQHFRKICRASTWHINWGNAVFSYFPFSLLYFLFVRRLHGAQISSFWQLRLPNGYNNKNPHVGPIKFGVNIAYNRALRQNNKKRRLRNRLPTYCTQYLS